jgi:hypothetical protein
VQFDQSPTIPALTLADDLMRGAEKIAGFRHGGSSRAQDNLPMGCSAA